MSARAELGRSAAALAARRFEEALAAADKAVAAAPSEPDAWAARAEAKRRLNDLEGALADLDRAAALMPGEPRFLGARAEIKRRLGDWAGAEADATGWAQRAEARRCGGRLKEALAAADSAVAEEASAWALVVRAKALRALGRNAEAERSLADAVAQDPGSYLARAWHGEALRALGRGPEALAELDQALRCEPSTAWARVLRGALKAELGDEAGAERDLEAGCSLDARASGAYDILGDGRSGLARDGRFAWAWAWRAGARLASGDAAGALSDLDAAVARDPRAAWLRARRGEAAARLGRWRRALSDLDRAVAARGSDCRARFWRAEARRALGDARGALRDLNLVAHLEPDLSEPGAPKALFGLARVGRALVFEALGAGRAAADEMAAGARLLPEAARDAALGALPPALRRSLTSALCGPARRSDREWRLWADKLFQSGRGLEVAGPARAALKRAPLSAGLHLVLWRAQHPRGLGGPKGADLLERATELGLDVPEAWAWLGHARLDAGRMLPGLAALARAVELDPGGAWGHAAWPATFSGVAPRTPNERRFVALGRLRVPRAQAALAAYLRSRVALILNRVGEAEAHLLKSAPLFAACRWFHDSAVGELYVRLGRFAEALPPLERAAAAAPAEPRAHFWRGEALYWLGRSAEAEASWAEGASRGPGLFWVRGWRAQNLLWQGRWEEAAEEAAAATALEPGHGWAWGWLGAAKARAGRPLEGLKDLRRALALDPTDREARIVVGEALALAGRPKEALRALALAARRDPAHPWIWVLRAWVKGSVGDDSGMLDDYAKAGLYAPELLSSWAPHRPRPDAETARADIGAALALWEGNRTWRSAA